MSQRDGFGSGFIVGAVFGGVVGGILGALIATREGSELLLEEETESSNHPDEAKKVSAKRRPFKALDSESQSMETARRSLEDKIAQLNATIDEVRKQLGNVNGNSGQVIHERSLSKDS